MSTEAPPGDAAPFLRLSPAVRRGALAALVLAVLAGAIFFELPDEATVSDWVDHARDWGAAGAFAIALLFIPSSLFGLPGSPVTLVCAAVFGFGLAFPAVVVGSNLGALAAFLVGRTLLREEVANWVTRNERLAAVDRAIGQGGFKLAFLLRLSPLIPFNALNYALASMRIRPRDYVVATFSGMIPGTILYCWVGSTLGDLADAVRGEVDPSPASWALVGLGLLATVVAVVMTARAARAELDRTLEHSQG